MSRRRLWSCGAVLLAITAAYCSYLYLWRGSWVSPDWRSLTRFPEGYAEEIDIYGIHSPTEKLPPVSEETFRAEFRDEEVFSLLETGTLSSLLERFGEPIRFYSSNPMYDRYLYTRISHPDTLCIEYPTGIVFHIADDTLIQVDFMKPGHFLAGKLQVGSPSNDVFSLFGPPVETVDQTNVKSSGFREHSEVAALNEGVLFTHGNGGIYYPSGQHLCLCLFEGHIRSVSVFRPATQRRLVPEIPVRHVAVSPPTVISTGNWWRSWLAWRDCSDNLKALGESLRRYKEDNQQKCYWPPLDSQPGRFMFKREEFLPAYINNARVFQCPNVRNDAKNSAELLDDQSYWYFGYFIKDEREGAAFLAAYYDSMKADRGFEDDLPIPYRALSGTQGHLLRFREGVERYYIFEIGNAAAPMRVQSETFVMVERPGHHWRQGGHVLFMDGHVEWMDYPRQFPMTLAFIEGLIEMEKKVTEK